VNAGPGHPADWPAVSRIVHDARRPVPAAPDRLSHGAAAQRRDGGRVRDGAVVGTQANCWSLVEAAGHEGPGRMQGLLRTYACDWKDLRAELPALPRRGCQLARTA
jgi:hypothetical protein